MLGPLEGLPRRLRVLYLVMLFRGVANGVLIPVLPLYVRSIGVGVLDWGLMASVFGVAMMSTEAVWGFVSDRMGKEAVIVIGMAAVAILAPAYVASVLIPILFVLQFLRGALGVAAGPASRALISDLAPAERMGSSMGLWYTSTTVGQIGGTLIGGWVVSAWGFGWAFYFSSAASVVGVALTLAVLGRSSKTMRREGGFTMSAVRRLLGRRSLHVSFALAIILLAESNLVGSFLPVFAGPLVGASAGDVGVCLAVYSSVCVVVTLVLGRFSDRLGRLKTAALGLGICGLSDLGYIWVGSFGGLLLATAGVGIGFSLAGPSLLAYLAEVAGREERGAAMGVYGVFEDVGVTLGPVLYGLAWSGFGLQWVFVVGGALGLFGVALSLPGFRSSSSGAS